MIPNLLINDGDRDRIRRRALLDEKNRFVGVSVHEHYEFDYLVLFLFADVVD